MKVTETNAVEDQQATAAEKVHDETIQLLTFTQGAELYAIPIDTVREVIDTINITTIPLVPNYIRGVINLRGKVIPVIDLKARFRGVVSEVQKLTSIIINEIPYEEDIIEIGLLIDQVKEVIMFPVADIDETPDFGTEIRPDYISGIGRYENNYIIILDTKRVLDIDELSQFSADNLNV